MKSLALLRFFMPTTGIRTGVLMEGVVHDVTPTVGPPAAWLQASAGRVAAAIDELRAAAEKAAYRLPVNDLEQPPATDCLHWLPPVDSQDIWAAGVTYARSRIARQEEAVDGGDVYARVYSATRPELFFKAQAPWVVGKHDAVGIRRDATWNVPEPELALVLNPALEVVGYTIGNDMSSRDIEGENPLYLPQAKIYRRSCALGPAIVLEPLEEAWPQIAIHIRIERQGSEVFSGSSHSERIHRRAAELVEHLGRCLDFATGAVLLTGTGIVPPDSFTLAEGDRITIAIDGVGELVNHVIVI